MIKERLFNYVEEDIVTNHEGDELQPTDDDYEYYKAELENLTDSLSDDYCKYDNE